MNAENASWDFDAARRQASARWNETLRHIEVRGGTDDEKRIFYTALYHALLHPNTFSDANGEYIGFDDKIRVAKNRVQYTNFSGWDIYRCEVQLIALLFPKIASDMAQSLVADAEQGGGLPIWAVANDESGAMYGDPSTVIISSVYAFGARDFDTRSALRLMIRAATDPDAKSKTYPQRKGLREYLQYGFIPMDAKDLWGSPSIAQEYMIADFALAQFAKAQGDEKTYREMMPRAQFWTRLFDPQNKYIRARYSDGSWLPGFDFKRNVYDKSLPWSPASHKSYVEGNAAQYTWMIPHNMRALFDRIGGNDVVIKRLNDFFKELNAGSDRPYFFIGNEPVFAAPWAYDFSGEPYKTQAVVRRAMREMFSSGTGGLPGNDDLGAMSAWYVWAAIGLYPAIPGVGGFAINSPLFSETIIRREGGKEIRIIADGARADSPYVQTLRLDNQIYEKTWLPFDRVANGATLRFKLSDKPNVKWATAPDAAPPSFNEGMAKDESATDDPPPKNL